MQTIERILFKALTDIAANSTGNIRYHAEQALRDRLKHLANNPAMFDCYEIERVAEYRGEDGSKFCEPLHGANIEEVRARPDYITDFYTLYGHMANGGVMALADYDYEQTAENILKLIGGELAP